MTDMQDIQKLYEINGYKIYKTEDSSYSLQDLNFSSHEFMHHRGGAYTETQLVYGELIRKVLDLDNTHFFVFGLGCGYIEIILALDCIKRNIHNISLTSVEKSEFLVSQFKEFFINEKENLTSEIARQIILLDYADISLKQLKKTLRDWYQSSRFQILSDVKEVQSGRDRFNGICFDAYSSQTDKNLWTENFLEEFLNNHAADNCIFSTYACTGNLSRALKKYHFNLEKKPGFKGKRERTWAERRI